jgi:hypothetical protein
MAHGGDDGAGANNGLIEPLTLSVINFEGSATSGEKMFDEKGASDGEWFEEGL